MLNKIDVKPFDELTPENKELLTDFQKQENVKFFHTSNVSQEGIMQMRNEACDALLLQRVEAKLRGKKTENVLNRLHVAMPEKRDDIVSFFHVAKVLKIFEGTTSIYSRKCLSIAIRGRQTHQNAYST